MRNAMRFWDPPRGKCQSCAEFGDFPWKVRNADGTWDFLRGKYEMPCGLFDFLSRKDENPIRLCNLEFSRSKIALPCVPNRCAISGIRRRGGYISVSANFRHRNQLLRPVHSPREPFGAKPQTVPQAPWAFKSSACCSVPKRGRRFHGLESKTFWLIPRTAQTALTAYRLVHPSYSFLHC